MSGRAHEDPADPTSTDAANVNPMLDEVLVVRSAATGDEANLLRDAGARVESVVSVLAHAAFQVGEPAQLIDSMVRLLDQAGQEISQATGT